MNLSLTPPLLNIPLLPVCHYISAFSIFFTGINLLRDEEKNQTVPVINALFQYLDESTEPEGKIQLLLKIFNETNNNLERNPTLDLKYVNEAYQYIINSGLFHHYGNITGYLAGIRKKEGNITSSAFRIVLQNLSDKYICNNLCSTRNGSTKLTPLAIEKILKEYVWPVYTQERDSGRISDGKKVQQPVLRRPKRQPGFIGNVDASKIMTGFESHVNEQPNVTFNFGNNQDVENSRPYLPNYESVDDLWNRDELDSILQNLQKDIQLSTDKTNQQSPEENVHFFGDSREVQNKKRRYENLHGLKKYPRIGNQNSINTSNTDYNLDLNHVPEIRTGGLNLNNDVVQINYEGLKEPTKLALPKIHHGKSKRMLTIERAANLMFSCQGKYKFTEYVYMLQNYLLKLEQSKTTVPIYHTLAWDYCYNAAALKNYEIWKIPRHKFIDDVLYQSYFGDISTLEDKLIIFRQELFFQFSVESIMTSLKIYKSSIELQESLRVQDFLFLHLNLMKKQKLNEKTEKRIMAALYRLALRESEENWAENKNTLYSIHNNKDTRDLELNFSARQNYTFKLFNEFSTSFRKEISKLDKIRPRTRHIVMFEIELENQVGIVNIDRIFGENNTGRYVIPSNLTFSISRVNKLKINERRLLGIEISDKRSKEEKMIEIIKKLHDLLTNFDLFHYYSWK